MKNLGVRAEGRVTYWSIAGIAPRDALAAVAANLHLPNVPELGPALALRAALKEVFPETRHLVRPTGERSRLALVNEQVRPGNDPEYTVLFTASVDGEDDATVSIDRPGYATRIQEAFEGALRGVPTEVVSQWLTQVMRHLGAVRLRESGGVYWVPSAGTDAGEWPGIARAINGALAAGSVIYTLSTAWDESSIHSVHAALTREVESESAELQEAIAARPGVRARETQAVRYAALDDKITRYEAILGESLERLRRVAATAMLGRTAAALAGADIEPLALPDTAVPA